MRLSKQFRCAFFAAGLAAFLLWTSAARAQTTSFTYQGRLTDGGTAANGNYDLQFALFDSVSGGAQIGATQTVSTVSVSAGIFTVQLDFGASAFPGAPRFLEIGARLTGAASFTTLSPRQPVTSTPQAIRALNAGTATTATTATNATQLGGVAASQYVVTSDSRLSDSRPPTPGSSNYIQNATTPQASANFNISGNGTAGGTLSGDTVNATTQYNLGGNHILSKAGFKNLFAGVSAGQANTSGGQNAFFGYLAGRNNTTANVNSFFGSQAGEFNTEGCCNSFFGTIAGRANMTGQENSFFGAGAGNNNSTGSFNTLIGASALPGSGTLINATAIGALAEVDQSDSLVLGSIAGFNGATTSVSVGIGTTTPISKLHILSAPGDLPPRLQSSGTASFASGWDFYQGATGKGYVGVPGSSASIAPGEMLVFGGAGTTTSLWAGAARVMTLSANGNVGIGTLNPTERLSVNGGISVGTSLIVVGQASFNTLGSGGSTTLCRNAQLLISTCSSSLRYKKEIAAFSGGLDLIRRLHPITFSWRADGTRDLGLGAEDVAKVEPLLVTHNDKGEIEGVKYDRLNVILINAVKEQQNQIETLRAQNAALSARLRGVEKTLRERASSTRRRH